MLLEEELVRRLRAIDGLDIVRQMSSAIAATGGAVPISDLGVAGRASSTYVVRRFKAVVGVTPKRLARSYRFTSTVLNIPATRWTAGRCQPIDSLQERPLATHKTWDSNRGGTHGESGHECVGVRGWLHCG